MATLAIDLSDVADVRFGIGELTRRLEFFEGAVTEADVREATTPGQDLEAGDQFAHEIRGLLSTRTGQILIAPFVRHFPEAASIEDISTILPQTEGVDPFRKAHSLVASLGRWETPRAIQIFESVGGRPQRYRMNPRVRAEIERQLAARNAAE